MNAPAEAEKRPCPIVIVGMQKQGPLEVTYDEAAHRAAELGLPHFHVQGQHRAQIMGPFAYLAQRHIQARVTRIGLSKAIV
jgi:hypothetical protein